MRTKDDWTRIGSGLLLAALVTATVPRQAIAAGDGDGGRERDALRRALRLVTVDADVQVRLIDPELAPDPEPLRKLDAFVVREPGGALRPVIYINRQCEIVRQAAAGSEFFVTVLAAVIHHETHHLKGASEAEARRAETEFFRSLVDRAQLSPSLARDYLQLLAERDERHAPTLERD